MALYTRRGDGGETDLGDGRRAAKDDGRVEVYGTLDELSACLGLARALARPVGGEGEGEGEDEGELSARLLRIERQLSALAGWFACPGQPFHEATLDDQATGLLEREIDEASALTGPLRAFVMPGQSPLEAALHLARTVCRRAERRAVSLARQEEVDARALAFLNRLSDWLFAEARRVAETPVTGAR